MPQDTPEIKIENTRGHGAEIVFYDRFKEDREEIGRRIAEERNAIIVPPYDDVQIIAGQGTVGLDFTKYCEERDIALDALLVPCGGGGLIAGCATAFNAMSPETTIYAVEPERFDDTKRSLAEGARIENDPNARSICDALLAPTPGEITFSINHKLLTGGLAISDGKVREAIIFAFQNLKIAIEPGGGVALAAVLDQLVDTQGQTIGVLLSGGNISLDVFTQFIGASLVKKD